MKKNHLTLKIFFLIVANDLVDAAAQLAMKKGLNDSSPLVLLGVLVFALNFLMWIVILYKVDLSIAMPVGSASYIFVPVAAALFLHEQLSPVRWAGILCVALGTYFVSQSKKLIKEGQ